MKSLKLGLLLMGAASIAAGQNVYGLSAIGVWSNPTGALSLSETWADYSVIQYYDMLADGFLYDWTTIIASGSDVDGYDAYLYLNTWYYVNKVYTLQTNHWVRAYYFVVQSTINIWQDPFGFSLMSTGNTIGQTTYSSPGTYATTPSYCDYFIGTTWIQDSTWQPVISGINVNGSQTPGSSGTIDVYGTDLVKPFNYGVYYSGYFQPSTATISGSDVSMYVEWQDWHDPGYIRLHYSIGSNAIPSNRDLSIVSPYGTSNPMLFQIQSSQGQSCNVPMNFRVFQNGTDVGNGTLQFIYTWDTSVPGTPLTDCTFKETVVYPGGGGTFNYPTPFPEIDGIMNPFERTGGMTQGGILDNHFADVYNVPPVFRPPFFFNEFTASQTYSWRCPCSNNGNWQIFQSFQNMPIVRKIDNVDSGAWKYSITKSGRFAEYTPEQ